MQLPELSIKSKQGKPFVKTHLLAKINSKIGWETRSLNKIKIKILLKEDPANKTYLARIFQI